MSAMICAETGYAPDRPAAFTARIPVKPIALGALCHEAAEPARPGGEPGAGALSHQPTVSATG
ncbi:MAG: hypothetical protein ACE5MG_04360 [Candidatus Methylomirabilales bacterium]